MTDLPSLRTLAYAVLVIQVLTFAALSPYYFSRGNWRLGISQALLAAVQAIIYSGGL